MFTPVGILNIGLSKIGATHVRQIERPSSSLERHCATNWPHWLRSELAKHRWVFATKQVTLVRTPTDPPREDFPNSFLIPTSVVRVIRGADCTTWQQEGRLIVAEEEELTIAAIVETSTAEFDPLFVEALACRVAKESAEYITQSNTKKADAQQMYDMAISDARKYNAFVRGPETFVSIDDYDFLTDRYQML